MQFTTQTPADLDEARAIIGGHFYTNFMDVLPTDRPWRARFDIALVPVTLGDLRFGADVRIKFGELGAYHVDVPLSGAMTWRQGSAPARTATATSAAVFQPVGDTTLERWNGDCRMLAVKIDRGALQNDLAGLLDAPVGSPVRFEPTLELARGFGAGWLSLLRLIAVDAGPQ